MSTPFHHFPSFFIIILMSSWLCLIFILTLRTFQIWLETIKWMSPRIFNPLQKTFLSLKSERLALTNGNEGESVPCSFLQLICSHPLVFNEHSRKSTYFFYKPMGVEGYQLLPVKCGWNSLMQWIYLIFLPHILPWSLQSWSPFDIFPSILCMFIQR
jgi:hypothetical protein